jgi:hypothetical protein
LAKYETRIKTIFGELVVHFDKIDEFRESITSLDADALTSIVNDKLGNLIVLEPRKAKPGSEFAYRFTPQGKVELVKVPSALPLTIGLLLYAYDPEPVEAEEIFRATGTRVATYIANLSYKKYFGKAEDGKILLTHAGRVWIQDEVLPKLHTQAANP